MFLKIITVVEHIYQNIQGWFSFPTIYSSVVNHFPSGSHFVEVGTWLGRSAAFMAVEIANSNKNIQFDCIDNWQGDGLEEHDPVKNKTVYQTFLSNIEPVKKYINPITGNSLDVCKTYKDGSLDFIFIDASHTYEAVKQDINAWFPKLKKGGMMAGHDYDWPEVRRAVDEYFSGRQIKALEQSWTYFNK